MTDLHLDSAGPQLEMGLYTDLTSLNPTEADLYPFMQRIPIYPASSYQETMDSYLGNSLQSPVS